MALAVVTLWLAPLRTGNAQSLQPETIDHNVADRDIDSRRNDQTPPASSPSVSAPAIAPPARDHAAIQSVSPDIYYLKDSAGTLVPVPLGMTFEDFAELYDLKHGLTRTAPLPEFTIETFSATGNVVRDRADLNIVLRIRILREGWVRVPLELGTAITNEPITGLKATELIVTFDRERRGYVAWIRAGAGRIVDLPLKVSFAVERTGEQSRLRMDLPRANNSLITLTVDRRNLSVRVGEDATLLPLERTRKSKTTFRVQGAHGPCEITWQPKASDSNPASSLIEVEGQLLVQVRGIDAVTTDAHFRTRSFGHPLESMRIRLPHNMALVSDDQPKYTVRVVEVDSSEAVNPAGQLVEIKMRQPTNDLVDIRLITEWTRLANGNRAPLEVADFQVLDAVRHHGHIALVAGGEWLVNWRPGSNVRRVANLPNGLEAEDLVAGFAYDRQPSSLNVSIDHKKTYLNVDPSFRFDVASHRVQMLGEFLINVRGAPAAQFSVHLPGWQVEDISAEGIVKSDDLELDQVDPLRIPLIRPISGHVKLTLRAVRQLEKGISNLSLEIPHLSEAHCSPPLLIVVPADNVALQSHEDADAYLTPEEISDDDQFASQQQQPLAYRYRGPADQARLSFDFALKPQSVTCNVNTYINLNPTHTLVRQTLRYQIRNEPLGQLRLRSLAAIPDQQLTIRLGGRKQSLIADDSFITDPLERGFRLTLPQPLTGPVDLEASFPADGSGLNPKSDATAELSVPLIMPVDGQLETNRVTIVSSGDASVTWDDDRWHPETETQKGEYVLVSDQHITEIDLKIDTTVATKRPTIVERAYFQTWLTTRERQDRAVFRLITESPQLRITLPSGALADQVQILVNGQLANPYREENRSLVVDNPTASTLAVVQLELVIPWPTRPRQGAFTVQLPRIEGVSYIQKYFWHLVMPGNEHLLTAPTETTREESWSWRGWTWGRRDRFSQRKLEDWSGGSHQQPPADANSQYLVSGFGDAQALRVRTVSRRLALSVAGSGVLLAGLALMFVPTLRHPAMLLVLAVGVLVFGAWQPQLALLLAQLGGATILLLILAKLLDWMTIRRRPVLVPTTNSRPGPDSTAVRLTRPSQLDDRGATLPVHSDRSDWSNASKNHFEQ